MNHSLNYTQTIAFRTPLEASLTESFLIVCTSDNLIQLFPNPVNIEIMSRPNIPKSPSSRNGGPPTMPTPALNRSKSEQKFNGKEGSPEKRVRLRDYLFIASTSSLRNNEKKQDLKNSVIEKDALKSSITLLKRNKYGLPNAEMYSIVKNEIVKEMNFLIQDLQGRLESLNADQTPNPTSQDLNYLYNIKRLVSDSIRPILREMDDLNFRRNGNVIKEIIDMALKNGPIKEENEEESRIEDKNIQDPKDSLQIFSFLLGGKSK